MLRQVVVFGKGGTLLVSPFRPPQMSYGRNAGGGGVHFRHDTLGAGTEGVEVMISSPTLSATPKLLNPNPLRVRASGLSACCEGFRSTGMEQ